MLLLLGQQGGQYQQQGYGMLIIFIIMPVSLLHTVEVAVSCFITSTKDVIDHPHRGMCVISVVSVCHTIAFESCEVEVHHLEVIRVMSVYEGHYLQITGRKGRKCLFPQCKTSFGNSSDRIKQSHEVCT